MPASDYLTDPEFLAFCRCWQGDGRCPFVFPDWLRDRGLDAQAAAAEWAAFGPDRVGGVDSGGSRPSSNVPNNTRYSWFPEATPFEDEDIRYYRDNVPRDVHDAMFAAGAVRFGTFAGAVAGLLDAWAAARGPEVKA